MRKKWKEVARLRFVGGRFHDRALDANALSEVQRFLSLVEATAKEQWYSANPEKQRLPPRFEERCRVYLRRINKGSSVAVLEARAEETGQTQFLDRDAEDAIAASNLAYRAFNAIAQDRPLPEEFPKHLVAQFVEFGRTLQENERIEIRATGKKRFVPLRPEHRGRWTQFEAKPYTDSLQIEGEVIEADVRQSRFQIWVDGKAIVVPFSSEQENFVITALRDHRSVRISVSGKAEFSPEGKPIRVIEVTVLSEVPEQPLLFNSDSPSIEDELHAIAMEIPETVWDTLPDDLNEQLDHYVYGTPKR